MSKIKAYVLCVYHSPRQLLIHVLFVLVFLYLTAASRQEDVLFENIVRVARIQTQGQTDTVFVKQLMVLINKMMHDRNDIFQNTEQLTFKDKWIHSVDADLMYGAGSCGGFSKVLARSLKKAGFQVRIGQMLVNHTYGGHILLETYLPALHKWVVMDPLFLLTFTNHQGVWASYQEVHQNWHYYQTQIQTNYNYHYNYAGIRYTNWTKIPVLGNLTYQVLKLVKGNEFAATFSLRPYLLDSYRFFKWVIAVSYAAFIILSFILLYKLGRLDGK